MYRIEDKAAAIREVQKYLRAAARENENIPLVAVDGNYGTDTADAVRAFQKCKSLPETGVVNYATFTSLYEAYLVHEESKALNSLPSHGDFPLRLGDTGEGVVLLHSLLRMLGEYYPDLGRIPETCAFSGDTENAVRYLQTVFILEPSGIVTKKLYLRMERELAACRMCRSTGFSYN